MGLKPTPKFFFEKISKNMAARGVQNFVLIEGAAELLLEQSQKFWPQISALKQGESTSNGGRTPHWSL